FSLFTATSPTQLYTLSLHDALPICSGISYLEFLAHLGPVAAVGLFICWLVIVMVYPTEFSDMLPKANLPPPRPYTPLLTRTLVRSEEHTSELQSRENLVCRLLLEKK